MVSKSPPSITPRAPLIVGVELGGTKGVALIARGRRILQAARVPTTSPRETLGGLSDHISVWTRRLGSPAALGIASFGPVDDSVAKLPLAATK